MNVNKISNPSVQGLDQLTDAVKSESPVQQIGQTFQKALDSLSQTQETSDNLLQQLASGENVDIHQVMLTAETTDVNYRVALAIRDRLVDAYHEITRMAV